MDQNQVFTLTIWVCMNRIQKGDIDNFDACLNFSMKKNKTKYWAYSDCNCTLNYYYKFLKHVFKVETELTEGWQLVEFDEIHYRD